MTFADRHNRTFQALLPNLARCAAPSDQVVYKILGQFRILKIDTANAPQLISWIFYDIP